MGTGRVVRWVVAPAVVGQVVLVGVAWQARSVLLLAIGELALLAVIGAALALGQYHALRRRFVHERERATREAERRAVADDVHDLVGHELSLLAMQAGLLQLRTEGEAAELAGRLRAHAHETVEALHDSIALLDPAPGGTGPRSADPGSLVAAAVAAGARVDVVGDLEGCSGPTRVVASRIVREGLTNAARHAPDRPVEVALEVGPEQVAVRVTTRGVGPGTSAEGRGLGALRRRVASIGGTLEVTRDEDHVLVARLPRRPDRPAAEPSTGPRRRALGTLVRQAVVPVAVTVAVLVGFYTWASTGATIEPGPAARLEVGMPAREAAALLPSRQAPVRLVRAPAPPAGSTCRSYTDGNVPLAVATLEVCTGGGVVTRVTDLAARPLR